MGKISKPRESGKGASRRRAVQVDMTTELRLALRRWRRVDSDVRCGVGVLLLRASRDASIHRRDRHGAAVAQALIAACDLVVIDMKISEHERDRAERAS